MPLPKPHAGEARFNSEKRKELSMTESLKTIIYPGKDLAKAKKRYSTLLGAKPIMDEPYYVGFNVEGQDIGLDPNGHSQGMTGPVGYWNVDDIAQTLNALLDAGVEVLQEVKDVGGGKLVASVKDADGNGIGLIQPA
jgi:predicted enzyme related to lactoylglutathione lyase